MKRRAILSLSLTLPVLAACASVDTSQTTTLVGVVETIDLPTREVLIRGNAGSQSGMLLTMVAGRAVQRLDQIRPGDRVTVTYYQALAARAGRPLSTSPLPFAGASFEREAQRPGGEITRVRSGRVTITALDRDTNTVSFVGPNNISRTVTVQNPEIQSFIRSLRVGEQVDLIYEEALAISISPMQ
ncbi:MAG: hypothetical protein EBY30_15150 [Rhodospirillales bacterium]|nr:hypothetical protein [Rhodospirillales bacterium]